MVDFHRPLHRRIATVLSRLDANFLQKANCYFGGGTQLVLSHGEFRESKDIDLLVSSTDGLRMIREAVTNRSLGPIFKEEIALEREVIAGRDAIRTYVREDDGTIPIKFEIIIEGRISLDGAVDPALGVPILAPQHAIAEKLMANVDRGRAKEHRSRDLVDLAFVSHVLDDNVFINGYELAWHAYGGAVLKELADALKMVELDAHYRAECIKDLVIEDKKALLAGIKRMNSLRRLFRKKELQLEDAQRQALDERKGAIP